MTLKEQINADFITAYKNQDFEKKDFLGLLKGDIQNNVGKMIPDTDENILKVIKIFEKNITEVINVKKEHGQSVEKELRELSYLKPYQPQWMSEDEIRIIVKEILNRGLPKNFGPLMGLFNKENKGKPFENETVAKVIREEIA